MFFPLLLLAIALQPVQAEATAAGTFDVAAAPGAAGPSPAEVLTFAKTYHGPLDGSGTIRMVGVGDPASGTASYAGVEQGRPPSAGAAAASSCSTAVGCTPARRN